MEGNAVSSSSTEFTPKSKDNCDRWNDDLCSNINYTKPWYRSEIRKLKTEVSQLEANLNEDKQSFSTVHLDDILGKLINKLSRDKQASLEGLDVRGRLNEDGQIDIKRLERFTALCIHDTSLKVEEEKEDVCVTKHYIHGSCRGIVFEVNFLVEESTKQDDKDEAIQDNGNGCTNTNLPQVISLDVSVQDHSLTLKEFLEYVKEEKQLQQFFVTLQNYSKWKRDRVKTFNHFQNSYPELVTYIPVRDESMMTICNQQHPSIRVNIFWNLLVSREGKVKPSFDLQSFIPSEQLDNKGFVRKMRSKFLNLLGHLGIEKSIEVIILSIKN